MFNIGDKVVYPMHGAGEIEAIEEKEVLGNRQKYYIMKLPLGDMKLMIPIRDNGESGLRQIIPELEADKVLGILKEKSTDMPTNWNHRYRANMEKIKSGNIYEVAEVVRNLSLRDRDKGLSTGEKKMLECARQILVSELIYAKRSEETHIMQLISECLA
ncbi:MAG: CarD family transcriptional regulator [Bacillota bacterium]